MIKVYESVMLKISFRIPTIYKFQLFNCSYDIAGLWVIAKGNERYRGCFKRKKELFLFFGFFFETTL
jgi:hypothetical protein